MRVQPRVLDAANALDGVRQAARNHEQVVDCPMAGGARRRENDSIDQVKPRGGAQLLRRDVPVATDKPRPLEQADGGSRLVEEQEVSFRHTLRIVQPNGPTMEPAT